MAREIGEIYVSLTADLSGYTRGLKKFGSGLRTMNKAVTGFMSTISMVAVGIGAVTGAATAFATKAVKEANKEELALERLQALLNNVTKERDKTIDSLVRQAHALKNLTGRSVVEIETAQAMLASFQLTKEHIEIATPRVLDIAAAVKRFTGEEVDLQQVAIGVGKALDGNTGVLGRMGIVLSEETKKSKKFADIIADIDMNAKGAAEAVGKTFGGRLSVLRESLGDVMRAMGRVINKSEVLREVMHDVGRVLSEVARWMGEHGDVIILTFNNIAQSAITMFTYVVSAAKLAFNSLLFQIRLMVKMATLIPGMGKQWKPLLEGLDKLKEKADNVIPTLHEWRAKLEAVGKVQSAEIRIKNLTERLVQLREEGKGNIAWAEGLTARIREQANAARVYYLDAGRKVPEALQKLASGSITAEQYVKQLSDSMGGPGGGGGPGSLSFAAYSVEEAIKNLGDRIRTNLEDLRPVVKKDTETYEQWQVRMATGPTIAAESARKAIDLTADAHLKEENRLKELEQVGWRAGQTIANAFGRMTQKGADFGDILKTLIAQLAQMALPTLLPGVGGILGSLFGGLFGFQKGGIVPGAIGAPMPVLAHGGEVLMNPKQINQLIAAVQSAAGGGHVTINALDAQSLDRLTRDKLLGILRKLKGEGRMEFMYE